VAELVRGALEGLRQAADAMENSQRGSDLLAKGMVVATDRFEGLDENLALTLRRLNEGLSDFRQQITDFVSDIDKGFSRSVESLSAIASSLDDTAEQLVDAGVKRSA
jgi:ABC-type transporter Mla subunit MlaD